MKAPGRNVSCSAPHPCTVSTCAALSFASIWLLSLTDPCANTDKREPAMCRWHKQKKARTPFFVVRETTSELLVADMDKAVVYWRKLHEHANQKDAANAAEQVQAVKWKGAHKKYEDWVPISRWSKEEKSPGESGRCWRQEDKSWEQVQVILTCKCRYMAVARRLEQLARSKSDRCDEQFKRARRTSFLVQVRYSRIARGNTHDTTFDG